MTFLCFSFGRSCFKGFEVMGFYIYLGVHFPQIFCAPSGETIYRNRKT